MNLQFTKNGLDEIDNNFDNDGELMILSKASDIKNKDFSKVVQIIDESGNEINCTVDKFIEIFDKEGLDGFIM